MAETAILKKKKKKTYVLIAKEFNNMEIGETLASEDNLVLGRTIEIGLNQITNDPKTGSVKIKFKVNEVKEGRGYCELVQYFMIPTYVRRVVKPGKEKIEDSFLVLTKDNVKLRIKPILLTKAETQHSLLSSLRFKTREIFVEYCKKNDYNRLLDDIISHNLQKTLRDTLKKIYPLNVAEIRLMEKL